MSYALIALLAAALVLLYARYARLETDVRRLQDYLDALDKELRG